MGKKVICEEPKLSQSGIFGEDLNQTYMDKLYARLATHFENKINWLYANLSRKK